ncbi:MAG: ribonuclease HIII [Bacilli bacterium]|nr:ribonuclease HIII [Bacilli bacterium]
MQEFVTIKVNEATLNKMKHFYKDFIVPNDGEYVFFCAKVENVVVQGFSGKKAIKTVTFAGDGALQEAKIWDENAELYKPKEKVVGEWLCTDNQIGSDEVGVGDFLLPMIVCAAFVRAKDLKILKEYGVTDSKKIKDEEIMQIGEALSKKFFISKLTLPNEKYNEMILKGENLNSLKAKMHNRALLNLYKKFPDTQNIFIDQFVKPETYFKYLNDANEPQIRNLTFRTKGESYYPCVALASVMARYSFLLEKKKIEDHYKMKFPFGASKIADDFAKKFIKKYGLSEFNKIAKKNFANYSEAISNID